MLSRSKLSVALLASLALLAFAPGAQAQATRTWVSGVGNDANPCSRTAPCKTFAGAISKTATAGEISVLDPGGFGAVNITKSIAIVADGSEGGILASLVNGIIINAPATATVTIRGLVIEGAGNGLNGIRFLAGGALHIEDCAIQGFTGVGIDAQPANAAELYIKNTVVRNNNGASGGGILLKPTAAGSLTAVLDNVNVHNNRYGVRVEDRTEATVTNSVASGSTTNGFVTVSASAAVELNLESSVASGNLNAGVRSEGLNSIVRISGVMSVNNGNGLQDVSSGQIISFGNNRVDGNSNNGAPTSTPGEI
jgi:hypothetical protein